MMPASLVPDPKMDPCGRRRGRSREVSMSKEFKCVYASFKSDRQRLWALISRDLRIVAVSALCAAGAGGGAALRELVARWL